MYITNITDYDQVTDDCNDTISVNNNCTNSENNTEIVIPLITIIPCAMPFICLISLMVYTLIKPFFKKKIIFVKYKWRNIYNQIIQLGVI